MIRPVIWTVAALLFGACGALSQGLRLETDQTYIARIVCDKDGCVIAQER